MLQPIVDFDQDEEGHWRAVLACGHRQHVRHDPPLVSRSWVLSPEGRASRLGERLNCVKCDDRPLRPHQRLVARLGRLNPMLSGVGTLANHPAVRRIVDAPADRRPVWSPLRCGARIRVDPADFVGRAAAYCGDLDPKITWLCRRLLRPGDTAIDVGANVGVVTLAMAAQVGAGGRVIAFEPNPTAAALLAQSIEANGFRQVELHRFGLADADGEMTLTVPADNAGKASLLGGAGRPVTVRVRRLDDVVVDATARLMKIDVEGFEASVLAGASALLGDRPPAVVLFECNDRSAALKDQPAAAALLAAGYELFLVPRCWLRMRLDRADLSAAPRVHDVAAVHRRAGPEVLRRLRIE